MYPSPVIRTPNDDYSIPVIDAEFDRFELSHELDASLREVEAAAFYHDGFDPEG